MYVGIKARKGLCECVGCVCEPIRLASLGFLFFYDPTVSDEKQENPIFSKTQQLPCVHPSILGSQRYLETLLTGR